MACHAAPHSRQQNPPLHDPRRWPTRAGQELRWPGDPAWTGRRTLSAHDRSWSARLHALRADEIRLARNRQNFWTPESEAVAAEHCGRVAPAGNEGTDTLKGRHRTAARISESASR